MAKKVQGIVIDIGGDTSKLTKALSGTNKEINATQKELKEVEKRLKLDPNNIELLAQKQELLNKNIDLTNKKVNSLKEAKDRADKAMANGTEVNAGMYRKLQREIFDTEHAVESLKDELDNVKGEAKENDSWFGKLKKTIKGTGDGFTITKGIIKDLAVQGIEFLISKTAELIEQTREYREDMNKLNTAFTTAKHTTEAAKGVYNDFYKILGESDRSVEAVNHLAQFVEEEKDLVKWGNIAAGVTATFTDSLAIESLTEAANETAKVAKVTGTLADAINWISKDSTVFQKALGGNDKALSAFNKTLKEGEPLEDAYTAALQEMNTEQERSKFITDTLNEAYSEQAEVYKEMNASIMADREATEKLMEAKAALASIIEPVMSGAKSAYADFAFSVLESWGLVIGESNRLSNQIKTLTENQNQHRETVQQNAIEEMAQVERYRLLYEELQNLVDQNSAVNDSDKIRAEYIVGELNEALGLEIEMNGNVIESLDNYGSKIDEIIAKRQAQILLSAQEELFIEATEKEAEAKKTLDEAFAALNEKERQHLEYKKNAMGLSEKEQQAWAQLGIEIGKLRDEYNKALDTYTGYVQDIELYSKATEAVLQGNTDEVIRLLNQEGTARNESAELAKKTEEEKKQALAEQLLEAITQYDLANAKLKTLDTTRHREEKERAEAQAVEMAKAYEEVGGQIIDGMVIGLDGKKHILFTKESELLKKFKDIFHIELDIHSPSKWAKKMMEWVDLGLAEGIEENTSAEEAMEKKVKNLKSKFNDLKGEADIDIKIADKNFELWKLANDDASEEEIFIKESGNLMTAIKNQSDKIDLVNEAYKEMKSLTGDNSEESKSLQLELLNEKIALEKLNDEMAELIENRKKLNENSSEGNGGPKSVSVEPQTVADYYKYIAKYGGDLAKQGLSNEDIQKAATSMTGYTAPSYNSENNSNVVNKNIVINQTINSPKPLSQYEVKKGTQKAIKQAEIEGGLM